MHFLVSQKPYGKQVHLMGVAFKGWYMVPGVASRESWPSLDMSFTVRNDICRLCCLSPCVQY